MTWIEITCAESHPLRQQATCVLVGRTNVDEGVFYREWGDANGVPVIKDDENLDDCRHYRWEAS